MKTGAHKSHTGKSLETTTFVFRDAPCLNFVTSATQRRYNSKKSILTILT